MRKRGLEGEKREKEAVIRDGHAANIQKHVSIVDGEGHYYLNQYIREVGPTVEQGLGEVFIFFLTLPFLTRKEVYCSLDVVATSIEVTTHE